MFAIEVDTEVLIVDTVLVEPEGCSVDVLELIVLKLDSSVGNGACIDVDGVELAYSGGP